MTNAAEGDNQSDVPIVVTPGGYRAYYIQDGNHRFASHKGGGIWVWIIYEDDRDKIDKRQALPQYIREWITGEITYQQLCRLAIEHSIDFNEL